MSKNELQAAYQAFAAADAEYAKNFDLLNVLDAPAAPKFTPTVHAGKMINDYGSTKALAMAVIALADDTPPESTVEAYRLLAQAYL